MNMHDEEQIAAIKEWWSQHGIALLSGLGIGISGVLGWQIWERRQIQQAEAASNIFQHLVEASATQSPNTDELEETASALQEQYADSVYAVYAALSRARLKIEQGELAEAEELLRWATQHSDDDAITYIARQRLIRLLLATRQLELAAQELDQAETTEPSRAILELRGDLHVLRREPDQARRAYQRALNTEEEGLALTAPFLKMKLADLGGPEQ